MIPILIAIACTILGIIIFNAVKEDAAYSCGKKLIATIGAISPILSLIGLLGYSNVIVTPQYKNIKEQNIVLNQKLTTARVDNSITNELIDEAEKYNKLCEHYYDTYQSNIKWSIFGRFEKNALEYKVTIPENIEMHNSKPSESSIQGEAITTEVTTNQTTIINGTEYELVPKE